MNELQRLKARLFKQEPSNKDLVYALCEVMKICGGYNQLMELPLPSLRQIINYLEWRAKEEQKAYKVRKPHISGRR